MNGPLASSGAVGRSYLCAQALPGFQSWLEKVWLDRVWLERAWPQSGQLERRAPRTGQVLIVADASAALADRDAILAPLVAALGVMTRDVRVVTAAELVRQGYFGATGSALPKVAALVLAGGDPFRLLSALRSAALLAPIRRAYQSGLPVVAQSAGALVSGPSLRPALDTSPFSPAPGTDPEAELGALELESSVVLPHHDRPGRAWRHWQAAQRHGARWPLHVLCDDEALIWDYGVWRIVGPDVALRLAAPSDAPQLAAVFAAAAAAAWSAFLPSADLVAASAAAERAAADGRFADTEQSELWRTRLADPLWRTLVAEDDRGVVGFARYGPMAAPTADARAELDLLYVHPRAWGSGVSTGVGFGKRPEAAAAAVRSVARRLLLRAQFDLAAAGHRRAWLWTEHRNTRALALYARAGWLPDGSEDARLYRGAPIRNIRLAVDLTQPQG